VHRKCRKQNLEPQRALRNTEELVGNEPREQALFEFLRGGAEGAAVVGGGDLPELGVGSASVNAAGVADRNVAVDFAVNQENGDRGGGGGIFWRNVLHVEVVLQAGADESDLDKRTQDDASNPGAEVEGLTHAVVGDLAKSGEGRFGGDGAEVRVGVEGLEELRGVHGFAEGEDAAGIIFRWLNLRFEKVRPQMNVVALDEAVGGEWAVAQAVGAGVGEKHGESMSDEELGVSGHAEAVIAESVEKEDGVAVGMMGVDQPGAEGCVVGRGDGDFGEVGVEGPGGVAHCGDFVFGERTADGVQCGVGEGDAADGAESQIEDEGEDAASGAAGQGHGLMNGTADGDFWFRELRLLSTIQKSKTPL